MRLLRHTVAEARPHRLARRSRRSKRRIGTDGAARPRDGASAQQAGAAAVESLAIGGLLNRIAPLQAALAGIRDAPARERSGFALLSSYGITLGIARAASYLGEQRQPAPALRGLRRRAAKVLSQEQLRVHHYVPGIAIAFASGATAILRSQDGLGLCLSVAFGTGVGLTLDEFLVLLERPNSYWADEDVAVLQCAAATVAAVALGVRFTQRGRRVLADGGTPSGRAERQPIVA